MKGDRKAIGAWGEEAALAFLVRKGYVVLEKNFRTRTGEIDIIAEDRGTIVFVEVKTRHDNEHGRPEEAVDYRKQQRIITTARYYLHRCNCADRDCRFDVVAVELAGSSGERITHIQHAFMAE